MRRFYRVPTIYVLEQKYEKNVFPCKPQFYYIKVGCKGVFITRTCFHDGSDEVPESPPLNEGPVNIRKRFSMIAPT